MNFEMQIVPSQLLIPAVCSGVLFLGWLLFTYMYLRSRMILHLTMMLLFFFGFVFVFSEVMILTTGQWLLDPAVGTQSHRIEQLAGAFFLIAIPLLVHSLTELTPGWKTVNRYLVFAGIGIALLFVVVAFIAPDLFISQANRKASWGTIQADYGRGTEGPLYMARDGLIAVMILYGTACFIFEMVWHRKIIYILPPFIGFLFAIHGAIIDILYVHQKVYYDLTPWSPHSRFSVGITIMILFCMSAVFRKFFDMAREVERAEEHASTEAALNIEQNRFIREVLSTGSGSLVDSMASLSSTISEFTRQSQEQAAATEEVTASIEEITAGVDGVKTNADEQYGNLEILLGTMEDLSGIIVNMNSQVEEALLMIDQISGNARAGEKSIAVMGDSMGNISASSQEMTGVIQIINDISDKINLLSLNAAIEAARAGDAGRGFAVVADEISKLADQTTSSIKSIDSLIRTNEQEIVSGNRNVSEAVGKINSIISDIEKIVVKITAISNLMNEQTVANQTVNENAEKVKIRSEQITHAMSEQKIAIGEISKTVGSINDLSQQNTHQIIQITDSTKSIVSMVEKMHLDIDQFAGKEQDDTQPA